METRKLIGFGNSSYVISLPASWIKKNKLKKGDELFVSESESELRVMKKENSRKEVRFSSIIIDKKPAEIVKMEIISAYVSNSDIIEIINKEKRLIKEIKSVLSNLSGIEIIEETSTKIIAKFLLDMKELSINGLIRRIDVITRSMMEDLTNCFKEDLSESINHRDRNVNRMVLLANRTIRFIFENPEYKKIFNTYNLELLSYSVIISHLEKIADQIKIIAKFASMKKLKKKAKEELKIIFSKIKERYLNVMKSYYSKNKPLSYDVEMQTRELQKECNTLITKQQDIEVIIIAELCKTMISHTKMVDRAVIDWQ